MPCRFRPRRKASKWRSAWTITPATTSIASRCSIETARSSGPPAGQARPCWAMTGLRCRCPGSAPGATGSGSRACTRAAAISSPSISSRSSLPIPGKLERRPVEGVGGSGPLPDVVDLRCPQGFVLRLATVEIAVEALHEASGRAISDSPQRSENRTGAGILESAREPDEAFARHLPAQARVARREGHQVGIQAHALEDLPGLEKAVVLTFGWFLRHGQG